MKRQWPNSIIGWKRVLSPTRAVSEHSNGPTRGPFYLVKLEIPPYAKVRWEDAGGVGHVTQAADVRDARGKLRAERAVVLDIIRDVRGSGELKPSQKVGISGWNHTFAYIPGGQVRPHNGFDEAASEACAAGIHFFLTRREAHRYVP